MTVGINDDYAILIVDDNTEFYYGYEKTVGVNKEWAFSAKINGIENEFLIGTSELEKITKRKNEEPAFYLLAGMAIAIKSMSDELF